MRQEFQAPKTATGGSGSLKAQRPPIILQHQLYARMKDRTLVDRQVVSFIFFETEKEKEMK